MVMRSFIVLSFVPCGPPQMAAHTIWHRQNEQGIRSLPKKLSAQLHHHGIVTFSQRENVPVGPSGPSSATRTTSREPSFKDSVPAYPLRFVLVKPGETELTLIPVDSSSIIMARVMALRAVLEAG